MDCWPPETAPATPAPISSRRALTSPSNSARSCWRAGGRQALGQQDLAGEAVAQDPEDLVADVGLQAVDGQDDAALVAQQRREPLGVGGGQGAEFVIAVQQVGDGADGDDDAAAGQRAVDLGDAAVLGVAEAADG